MDKTPCVYIVTNRSNTTLYVGVTSNLYGRMLQHKERKYIGFTSRYNLDKLIYIEYCPTIQDAIQREKVIKKLSRANKEKLIVKENPLWIDLWETEK